MPDSCLSSLLMSNSRKPDRIHEPECRNRSYVVKTATQLLSATLLLATPSYSTLSYSQLLHATLSYSSYSTLSYSNYFSYSWDSSSPINAPPFGKSEYFLQNFFPRHLQTSQIQARTVWLNGNNQTFESIMYLLFFRMVIFQRSPC